MTRLPILTCLAMGMAIAFPAAQVQPPSQVLNAADEAIRQERLAITGDLGLPPLPPLTASSPRNSLLFADRFPVGQDTSSYDSFAGTPVMVQVTIPGSETGSGLPEVFRYQLPVGYDPEGPKLPLVVAYHGFGGSAASVAASSTIDEEANARGWIYMAPTGIDDQLFGSPISQLNVTSAIRWMMENTEADPDRLYMVGFSMGGGVVTNYAARRRRPEGIMIAAVGVVSATLDWTQEYNLGTAGLHAWMENSFNFGGDPVTEPFNYRQASAMFFSPGTYPPLPGTTVASEAMATNNHGIPTYITYDVDDPLVQVPGVNDALQSLLQSTGGQVSKTVQVGTVDPNDGITPAPHSWAVLDEVELFDFFDGKIVNRYPDDYEAQLDLGGPLAWVDTTQRSAGVFSYIDGSADALAGTLEIDGVTNLSEVTIDAGLAGISGTWPVRVTATSADADGFTLRLTGFDSSPSFLRDASTNQLVPLVDSDPLTGSLIVDVAGFQTLDAKVVSNAAWTAVLTMDPNPVPIGQATTLALDAPAGSTTAWWILGIEEILLQTKGVLIGVSPAPPAILLPLPLDTNGDISFAMGIPNDPGLQGIRLPTQCLALNSSGGPTAVSNLWGFRIE